MINTVDLVLGILIGLYLLKNFGGPFKMIKNVFVLVIVLFVYAIISQLLLNTVPVADNIRQGFKESVVTKFSIVLVKGIYPVIERTAPALNVFIKTKILDAPTPQVDVSTIEKALPKSIISELTIPKLTIPKKLTIE